MDAFYKGCVSETKSKVVLRWLMEKLSGYSSKRVVIYGFGKIGKYLYSLLREESGFDVVGVIDRCKVDSEDHIKYISIDSLNNKELSKLNIDAVIVTPLTDSFSIEDHIKKIYGDEMSVINLLYEMNMEK